MCIYITGYINNDAYSKKFFDMCESFGIGYKTISNRAKKRNRKNVSKIDTGKCIYMLLTEGICDCETPLGKGDENVAELSNYKSFL